MLSMSSGGAVLPQELHSRHRILHRRPVPPCPIGSGDQKLGTVRDRLESQLGEGRDEYPPCLVPTPALLIWPVCLPGAVLSGTRHHELATHQWPLRLKNAGTAASSP